MLPPSPQKLILGGVHPPSDSGQTPFPWKESRGLEEVQIPQKKKIRSRKQSRVAQVDVRVSGGEKVLSEQASVSPSTPNKRWELGCRQGPASGPCQAPPGLVPGFSTADHISELASQENAYTSVFGLCIVPCSGTMSSFAD